jgi:hypothetical protein
MRKLGLRRCSEVERREGHGDMRVQRFLTTRISVLLLFSV